MYYVPKEQISLAKDLIYPVNKSLNPAYHKNNLQVIRESQQKNKLKKEEEDKYVPPEPYKLPQYKVIKSSLMDQTKEWVLREANKNRPQIKESKSHKKDIDSLKKLNHPLFPQNNKEISLFDQYYAEKLRKLERNKEHKNSNSMHDLAKTHDLENNKSSEELLRNEYEAMKKAHRKHSLPKTEENIKSVGQELPKINHNYIHENRQMVINNQVPLKYTKPPVPESAIHKDYGKMPDYLKEYKMEGERMKEYLKIKEEEAKYPKGTKLLKEEERLGTLKSLMESKVTITNILEKMPVTSRSISIVKRKEELEKKLDEIDTAILMFSKKKVFVKI